MQGALFSIRCAEAVDGFTWRLDHRLKLYILHSLFKRNIQDPDVLGVGGGMTHISICVLTILSAIGGDYSVVEIVDSTFDTNSATVGGGMCENNLGHSHVNDSNIWKYLLNCHCIQQHVRE